MRLSRIIQPISSSLLFLSGLAILIAATLGVADVVLNIVANKPLAGAFEGIEHLLVAIVFCALPFAVRNDAHISLSLFELKPGGFTYRAKTILKLLCSVLCYALLAYASYGSFLASFESREFSQGLIGLPVYPFKLILLVGVLGALVESILVPFANDDATANTHKEIL